jgi:UDP-2-acetamido-3-amino-2,3-dideoxy-glucuronate N-acetyltransferase
MNVKPFIGLVGVGYWGKNIYRDLKKLNILAGICETNKDVLNKLSKDIPKEIFLSDDFNTFLKNDKITAVMIALPAELHYEFAKKALLMGKDVFVEKPLALKVEHAEELVELSRKLNKILMVGHVLRYHPCVKKTLELVSSGKIGNIRYIHSIRKNLGKIRQHENVLWSFAPHDISFILALMNNTLPKNVLCVGQKHLHPDIHDVTDTFLEFPGNCFAHISVNWLFPKKEQKTIIVGDKGMIVFNDRKERGKKLTICTDYLQTKPGSIPIAKSDRDIKEVKCDWNEQFPLYLECEHFAHSCLSRSDPVTNGEEGLRTLRVLETCHHQLLNGKNGSKIRNITKKKYFSHPTAIVEENAKVGDNTKIWHYTHIMKASIGNNCSIGQNCFIADNAVLGNNCRVQNNVSVYDGVICGDNVFLGPSMVFCNDKTPRVLYSKNGVYDKTIVKDNVTIGANATILPGITLGKGCFVGAGSVVTKNVPEYSLVYGNPAKIMGRVNEKGKKVEY